MELRGIAHIHSSYSYDCRTSLSDIVKLSKERGYNFILMSEHNNRLNEDQMGRFVSSCREASDCDLIVIPGLELSFYGHAVHLLAFGLEKYIDTIKSTKSFKEVVREVREDGCLAVLAHPLHRNAVKRLSNDELVQLDGIEVWNAKNGNRLCPSPKCFRILKHLNSGHAQRIFAYDGLDLHSLENFTDIELLLDAPDLSKESVLDGLRSGEFCIRGKYVAIKAKGKLSVGRRLLWSVVCAILPPTKIVLTSMKQKWESFGLPTPQILVRLGKKLF